MKTKVLISLTVLCVLVVSETARAVSISNGSTTLFEDDFEADAGIATPYFYSDPSNNTESDPNYWTMVDNYDIRGVQATTASGNSSADPPVYHPGASQGSVYARISRRPYNAVMATEFAPQNSGILHVEFMFYFPSLLDSGDGNGDDFAMGVILGQPNADRNAFVNNAVTIYTKPTSSGQVHYKNIDGNMYTLYSGATPLFWTADEWQKWEIDFNMATEIWQLTINGVRSNLIEACNPDFDVTCFGFRAGANRGTAYVDATDGSSDPPPERYCGDIYTIYFDTDLSGPEGIPDCVVDLHDFAVLADEWLRCTDPTNPDNCE